MSRARPIDFARFRLSTAIAAVLLAYACDEGNAATPPLPPAAPSGGLAGATAPAPATALAPTTPIVPVGGTAPFSVSIAVPNVMPGVEGTECLQVRLPNTTPVSVDRVHNTLSTGSHHFIVTALTDPAAPELPRAACRPFRGAIAGAPLTITQKRDDQVKLPDGIGYRLNAGQVMHLELHYLNTSDGPVDVVGTANLYPAPAGAMLQEAAVLLVGTTKFTIPPHTSYENNPVFLKLPVGMDGVQFYAITGHTHRFGTRVSVSSASGPEAAGTLLYDPEHFNWEAPEMKALQPTVTLPAGGGFMVQCGWNNPTDEALVWGESATREMCFFWAYYYPRKPVVSIVIDDVDPNVLKRL